MILLFAAPCFSQTVRVPFTEAVGQDNIPLLLVQATVNGKPATMILDSGAMALTITPNLAKGTRTIGTVEHSGIGGSVMSKVVVVNMELGGETFTYVVAETQDLRAVSSNLGVKVDGLLGESVLSLFKTVTIDYKDKILVLREN